LQASKFAARSVAPAKASGGKTLKHATNPHRVLEMILIIFHRFRRLEGVACGAGNQNVADRHGDRPFLTPPRRFLGKVRRLDGSRAWVFGLCN
jgi:hypothetical protein